jgi:hypothetical protein
MLAFGGHLRVAAALRTALESASVSALVTRKACSPVDEAVGGAATPIASPTQERSRFFVQNAMAWRYAERGFLK